MEARCAVDCSPITTEMDGESSCFAEANLPMLNGRLCRVTEERKHLANELNALLYSKHSYKSGKGQQLYFSEALSQGNISPRCQAPVPRALRNFVIRTKR